MLRVGLTGGIGSGKSAASSRFAYHQVPIIDADLIARQVVQPGQPALVSIADTFGVEMLQSDGCLDRGKVRELVFADADQLKRLEAILHPHIREKIYAEVSSYQRLSCAYVILDIPLLIEKRYMDYCDRIVVVDCTPEQQVDRVMQRDQVSADHVGNIMQRQSSREQRLHYATDVLDNSGALDTLLQAVDALHEKFLLLSARH